MAGAAFSDWCSFRSLINDRINILDLPFRSGTEKNAIIDSRVKNSSVRQQKRKRFLKGKKLTKMNQEKVKGFDPETLLIPVRSVRKTPDIDGTVNSNTRYRWEDHATL